VHFLRFRYYLPLKKKVKSLFLKRVISDVKLVKIKEKYAIRGNVLKEEI
jgi:hypothetical protein